jgi:hypothetical protein
VGAAIDEELEELNRWGWPIIIKCVNGGLIAVDAASLPRCQPGHGQTDPVI